MGWYAWYADLPADRRRAMLKVNVECVADLTSLVLPEMLACRLGQVVNVAAVSGDLVLPTCMLYAAMGLPLDRQPELKSGIPAEQVAGAILRVLRRPRKTIIYVPRYFQLLPVFMLLFGWLFDRFGRDLARRLFRNAGGLGKKQ